jgi:CheY-like chemotaxis protein
MEPASGNTVLIIEDERDVVDLLALNLRKAGFTTSTACDGAAGLEKARREKPALIILDLMLPKMPGLEVCKISEKRPWDSARSRHDAHSESRGNRPDSRFGIWRGRLRDKAV